MVRNETGPRCVLTIPLYSDLIITLPAVTILSSIFASWGNALYQAFGIIYFLSAADTFPVALVRDTDDYTVTWYLASPVNTTHAFEVGQSVL